MKNKVRIIDICERAQNDYRLDARKDKKVKLSRCKVVNLLSTYPNVMQSRLNRKWLLPRAKAEFMSRGESRDGTSVNPSGLLMFSILVRSMKYN